MVEASNRFFSYTNNSDFKLKAVCKKCISDKGQENYKKNAKKYKSRNIPTVKCTGECGKPYKHTRQFFYYVNSMTTELRTICITCSRKRTRNYKDHGNINNIDVNSIKGEILLFNKLSNCERYERGLV